MASTVVKAAYWSSTGGVLADNIDFSLFTHIFCAFADLDPNSNEVTIYPPKKALFSTFNQTVRRKYPSIKILLSIGGANAAPASFAAMARQDHTRGIFIDSSIRLARSQDYNFDGLDLDWEYPTTHEEVRNLESLLKEWRAAVEGESGSTGKAPLLLTAATAYSPSRPDVWMYPTGATISSSLDWINVMAYDIYVPNWHRNTTAAPAALFNPEDGQQCGSGGIDAWIRHDVPEQKLVFGLPFYGRAWKLIDANRHGVSAPADGPGVGPNIDNGGAIAYNQIINQIGFQRAFDNTYITNYGFNGNTWIGYDDTESIAAKVKYAKGKKLRGYFAWQVSGDNDWNLSQTASNAWGA